MQRAPDYVEQPLVGRGTAEFDDELGDEPAVHLNLKETKEKADRHRRSRNDNSPENRLLD